MKVLRKVLKITGISLLVLILLAILIPILFKKQITRLVKNEINRTLTAKVDFSDVKLSLLRHFPRVTIILKDPSVIGASEFTGDTLVYAKTIEASANLFSVLKGKNIKIYGAYLKSPRIHLLVTKDGKMNWDIAKKTGGNGDTTTSAFKMSLKNYSINDGYIEYKDDRANTYMEWNNVDHRGSGDITLDEFTLSTVTHSTATNYTQDEIPYLINTKTDIVTEIRINNKTRTYTFNTDEIILNDLKLSLQGFIQQINNTTFKLDLKFNSPSNKFKNILSLVPDIYKKDFKALQASGDAVFNGFVKGTLSPTVFPAYAINLEIRNGSFKYPDLPKPIKNIQFNLKATNPDGLPDNAVFDISKGHLEMDNEPFDFKLILKKPQTAQYIDVAAKGKIDLSQLSKYIKLSKDTKLSGLVWADAFAKGNMSALQQLQGNFTAGGFFDIRNLYYQSKDFPQPIKNGNIKATIENSGGIADKTVINASSGHIEIGDDPLDFTLQLRNPMSTVDFSGSAKGKFTIDHLQQFTKLEPGTSVSGLLTTDMAFAGNKAAINQKQYDKITLNGTAGIMDLKYKSTIYPSGIAVTNTQLIFNQNSVKLSELNGNYLNTNFAATGVLNNLVGFLMNQNDLSGNLDVKSDRINLNDWIGTPATTVADIVETVSSAVVDPFLVPARIDFTINASASRVSYDRVDYDNVNGALIMNEEKITFKNIKAEALDGKVIINGSYSTLLNKKEPDIGFSYDIKDMDIQKVFNAFNTSQFLMPIGKFLSGKLSSQLSLVGNLKGDMMPKLMSLTGKGNLLLLQGVLKKFAPLEKLATILDIDHLKSIALKEIKNYIEFAKGKVLVKPFTLKIEEIEMLISGFHGFDGSIDYAIKMKLPRKVMGAKGNQLINDLNKKVSNTGLPFKLGETVNLDIKMSGTISNPLIGINLKGMVDDVVKDMEQQAKDFVQNKIDSTKQKVKDSLEEVKKLLEEKLKDKIKDQLFGKDSTVADSTKKKPVTILKNTIKDILHRKKKDSS